MRSCYCFLGDIDASLMNGLIVGVFRSPGGSLTLPPLSSFWILSLCQSLA